MKKKYLVSVDFGGTKILAALINEKFEIVDRCKLPTEVTEDKSAMINAIALAVNTVLTQNNVTQNDVEALCIGVPGSVDFEKGTVGTAPNLGIKNFNFRKELEKQFSVPILVENDVNLAALGINKFEIDNEKSKNILVVFVGTGIGGALILNGKLYRGSSFFAGEIGHFVVQKNGPKCGCGKKGCFEAIASRTAIVRELNKELRKKRRSILTTLVPKGKQIKSKTLAQAIKKKDSLTTKQVTLACQVIGETLGSITNILNVDRIVLGGGVIEALHKFMVPKIKESFKSTVMAEIGKSVTIVATKLGDDAAIYGGIALAEEAFEVK
jgi:glucokinase